MTPAIDTINKKVMITIRLSREQRQTLKDLSKTLGLPLEVFCRDAILEKQYAHYDRKVQDEDRK